MTAIVLRGDARNLPLPDESVDLICTSPPYWSQRSYRDGGEHYQGQIGDEPTPGEYIDNLIGCTREWVRVLKPAGNCWVNLGDKYGPDKSLHGLPWEYALRARRELDLILRRDLIWHKPSGLPESVTDRCATKHEYWFHLVRQPRYFAAVDTIRETTQGRADQMTWEQRRARGDAVRQGEQRGTFGSGGMAENALGKLPGSVWTIATEPLIVPDHLGTQHFAAFPLELPRRIIQGWSPSGICTACGFLLGSSYDNGMLGVRRELRAANQERQAKDTVLLEALLEQEHRQESGQHHLSAANDAGVRGGLAAGAPDGTEERLHDGAPPRDGGAPWPDAGSKRGCPSRERDQDGQPDREPGTSRQGGARPVAEASTQAVPMSALRRTPPDVRHPLTCPNCGGNSFRSPVIADPFGGTGTTSLVASVLGRIGISVDASYDYCRLARWRTTDPDQRAKAMRVDKPPKQLDGQLDMFGEAAS